MEPVRFPRLILILWLSVVVVALLSGIARAFSTVRAASNATATPTVVALTETLPVQTEAVSAESDQEEYPPPNQSSATDGITALVIILVAVILLGVIWGQRTLPQTRRPGKK